MHNSSHLIEQLGWRLNEILHGYSLVSCFSQNKDELIIEFNNRGKSFFIKAHLYAEFCCLSFPSSFKRARKNSIDLFPSLVLEKVVRVKSFLGERAFAIEFQGQHLFFKMFGKHSNVILFDAQSAKVIFKNNFKNDFELNIKSFTESPPKSDIKGEYFIVEHGDSFLLSLEDKGKVIEKFTDPVKALNEFFYLKISADAVGKQKTSALKLIKEKEKRTHQYLTKTKSELDAIQQDNHYQLWADLIMANIHTIKKGTEIIELKDFSFDIKHSIKLKRDLTPQQNAQLYYRKAKNKTMEVRKLSEAVLKKERLLQELREAKAKVENECDPEKINDIIRASGIQGKSSEKKERLPYRMVEFMNYSILIGKNASDNDELTLKHTYKEDLWLHAKDVAGSHVVIKHQAGKNFPKPVIERAAQLAAFYSKRKGESLCPVAYTAKKFVRKRKGHPPGSVVVEKEKVIMVEPKP